MWYKKPHRHSALIHAYADGAKIQLRSHPGGAWVDVEKPDWTGDEYRIKPQQESPYPKSSLNYSQLCDIVNAAVRLPGNEGDQTKIARIAADSAVAEFIESGEMKKFIDQHGIEYAS